jgi:hypothetical protein
MNGKMVLWQKLSVPSVILPPYGSLPMVDVNAEDAEGILHLPSVSFVCRGIRSII